MKALKSVSIIAFISAYLATIRAIEVYKAGRNGKPSWQESSEMRDRSVVPTPSLHDKIADFRRRSKIPVPYVKSFRTRSQIPVPESSSYRSASDDIPRPSIADIEADYRRRSGIPFPEKINSLNRRPAGRTFYKQKKNLINRILFSLPIGAQFPIYFSSQGPRKGTNKKSDVAVPENRYRLPYRMQTWGLPVNYKAIQSKRYQMPYMRHRATARQQIIPRQSSTTEARRRYYTPRSFSTPQLLSNRNAISLAQRNPPYLAPQSRYFLNRITRGDHDSPLKKMKPKDVEQSRKAVINKDTQRMRMDDDELGDNINTSHYSKEPISKDIENVLTKLLIMI